MFSRRKFLRTLVSSAGLCSFSSKTELLRGAFKQFGQGKLNRQALVQRHNPLLLKLDPLSPLTVGNGEFAFTADVTGLQTLPQEYEDAMPLCTMAQWGWHTQPAPAGIRNQTLRLTQYDTHGRMVGYHTSSEGQTELFNWLRENPHRLHLGRIGLHLKDTKQVEISSLSEIEQRLDLWSGTLFSRFKLYGSPVIVSTAVHPRLDLLAVRVESRLINEGRLAVSMAFPYGSSSMQAADWKRPERHETTLVSNNRNRAELRRTLDDDHYFILLEWAGAAVLVRQEAHEFILRQTGSHIEFTIRFSPRRSAERSPSVSETFNACKEHWAKFWTEGGAIELAGSRDPRAPELERRIVLSQYLTAIQCSGSTPPQETGLTVNSWYGKFHLEMHWWHAAHFALWNRLPLLERSLGWYEFVLPAAKTLARSQGYSGVRWPKMVGPDGRDSPSPIGPLLIWQQPHPIFYAELCYQLVQSRATLERYRHIVLESAEFMSSFAFLDQARRRYVLGPPVIPAQENHPPEQTWNPTFELAYWAFGLRLAQRWRERLGLSREPNWDHVINGLSSLPTADGVYLAHENCPQTFRERNYDHPSMLGAFGLLPGDAVDREIMRRTLHKTLKEWKWEQTWGWDYPLTAMTAARLDEPAIAVDALLMSTEKNRFLANGHNWQRQNLPCYLPANGGLLYAIAMMAAGWPGSTRKAAPGFPAEGSWTVHWEGLKAVPA